jgi:hypothetical protein
MNSENIKLLNETGVEICDILELNYIHGKFDFSTSPDFCGFSSKSISKKQSDKVVFRIAKKINKDNIYKLKYRSGHVIDIKIQNSENYIYYANVLNNTP